MIDPDLRNPWYPTWKDFGEKYDLILLPSGECRPGAGVQVVTRDFFDLISLRWFGICRYLETGDPEGLG